MKEITLYGAGGHCHAAVELIRSLGQYNPIAIIDDVPRENQILNIPVRKTSSEMPLTDAICISIGNNFNRKKVVAKFDTARFPSFIHKSSVVYPSVEIGMGTLILPNAVLDADVTIGDFCIVNNNATVSHNVKLGAYSHVAINAALAGGVEIGEGTLVGAGSIILPEVKIGNWVTVGAGAVVTKDIPDHAVVYGNPAKIIKYNHES